MFALIWMGVGCASVPDTAHEAARTAFSREHYCPVTRVKMATAAASVIAPPAIARDAERLAIWTERKRQSARESVGQDGASPRMVLASGCGEDAEYACFVEGGWVGKHAAYVDATTVCIAR